MQTFTQFLVTSDEEIYDNPICQQEMRACYPNLSGYPVPFLITLSSIHAFFALFLMITSHGCNEVKIRYDNVCNFNQTCVIKFETSTALTDRLFAYYELGSFYQTHFRFRGSRDYNQLYGKYLTAEQLSECEPLITLENTSIPLAPCGLRSFYVFTDLFELPGEIGWNQTGVAWDGEIGNLYKKLSPNYPNKSYWMKNLEGFPDGELDERYIVWFRTAPKPDFRKLFAWTNDKLPAGEHTIKITMNYDTKIYDGERWIVFVAQSIAGGRNFYLILSNSILCILYIFSSLITAIFIRRKEILYIRNRSFSLRQVIN